MKRLRLRQKEISFTNKLIILNIILFVILQVLFIINAESLDYVALKPSNIFQGKMIWTLFTSMFMHANLAHLFVNMVSLFFVGNFVERLIGKKRLAIFYLLSGIIAGLFFVFLSLVFQAEFDVYAVGASGAIFALAALLMILIPRLPVLVFFILPMPLWAAMMVLLFGLWIVSIFAGLPIGNSAHFGGFVCGVLFGTYLRMKYKQKVKILNTYILGRR